MPTARNAKGVDIIIYNHDSSTMFAIQVKSLSATNKVFIGSSLAKYMEISG